MSSLAERMTVRIYLRSCNSQVAEPMLRHHPGQAWFDFHLPVDNTYWSYKAQYAWHVRARRGAVNAELLAVLPLWVAVDSRYSCSIFDIGSGGWRPVRINYSETAL